MGFLNFTEIEEPVVASDMCKTMVVSLSSSRWNVMNIWIARNNGKF